MKCKHCSNEEIVKNGLRRGKQCFLCKSCGHQFTGEGNTELETMLALALHHQGLSTREIGKRLCFDHTTIHRRIKNSKTPLPQIIEHLKTIDTLECGCGEHRIALASIINKAYAAD